MRDQTGNVQDTEDAWETGLLGESERYAAVAETIGEQALNDAAGLKMISIRLQQSLIDDLKSIAAINGIGYQPLMRQALKQYVDIEKRRILRETAARQKNPS